MHITLSDVLPKDKLQELILKKPETMNLNLLISVEFAVIKISLVYQDYV